MDALLLRRVAAAKAVVAPTATADKAAMPFIMLMLGSKASGPKKLMDCSESEGLEDLKKWIDDLEGVRNHRRRVN